MDSHGRLKLIKMNKLVMNSQKLYRSVIYKKIKVDKKKNELGKKTCTLIIF